MEPKGKKIRSDTFVTRIARIILKIPHILAKDTSIVRRIWFKSSNVDDFEQAYTLVHDHLSKIMASYDIMVDGSDSRVLDTAALFFPVDKVKKLATKYDEEARADIMLSLRRKTSKQGLSQFITHNAVFVPLLTLALRMLAPIRSQV